MRVHQANNDVRLNDSRRFIEVLLRDNKPVSLLDISVWYLYDTLDSREWETSSGNEKEHTLILNLNINIWQ